MVRVFFPAFPYNPLVGRGKISVVDVSLRTGPHVVAGIIEPRPIVAMHCHLSVFKKWFCGFLEIFIHFRRHGCKIFGTDFLHIIDKLDIPAREVMEAVIILIDCCFLVVGVPYPFVRGADPGVGTGSPTNTFHLHISGSNSC